MSYVNAATYIDDVINKDLKWEIRRKPRINDDNIVSVIVASFIPTERNETS